MSISSPDPMGISGSTYGNLGQYPMGKVVTDPMGKLVTSYGKSGHRNEHPVGERPVFEHQEELAQTVTPQKRRDRLSFDASVFHLRSKGNKPRKARIKRWPDLSPFDLRNPVDIHNAHSLLVAFGWADDSYDGLSRTALAAVMARRLASTNPIGYFATIVRDGFTAFGPADKDFDGAKSILSELNY